MRVLLTTCRPLSDDKAAALVAKIAEFLGLDAEDVLLLPDSVATVTCAEGHPEKKKGHGHAHDAHKEKK